MSNLKNDLNSPQSNPDSDGNVHNQLPEPVSYQEGYVHGRATEHDKQEDKQIARENNKSTNGLIIGIGLTGLVALGVAAMFIFSPEPDNIIVPSSVEQPVPQDPVDNSVEEPESSTTIIDRTKETIREVPVSTPQEQPASESATPDVNVTIPQQPAPEVTNNNNVKVEPSQPQESPQQSQEPVQPDAVETP